MEEEERGERRERERERERNWWKATVSPKREAERRRRRRGFQRAAKEVSRRKEGKELVALRVRSEPSHLPTQKRRRRRQQGRRRGRRGKKAITVWVSICLCGD